MPPAHCITPACASPAQPSRLARHPAPGFTLVEILVATAIMSLIVSLVMVILTQTMTAWSSSSEELTLSMNARAIFDTMAQDLQGCILRSDGNQWLSLTTDSPPTGSAIPSVQDSRFIFFTSTPLHLTKDAGTTGAVGKTIAGDICAVEYRVTYADPFGTTSPPGSSTTTKTFSLHRVVVDPASTFFGISGTPIMGLNSATTPGTPSLTSAFDNVVDLPATPAAGLVGEVNTTPQVAIPYGGSQGPNFLSIPIYGAYSTANRLLDNIGQFTVFLYFTGQNPLDAGGITVQVYPQTEVSKNANPFIYYGGSPTPSTTGGYLDGENGSGNPPIAFLSLAYADITLSIMTDEGINYLQQNNGSVPQGFTWPQFLQKFSKTYTQRVPILVAPH